MAALDSIKRRGEAAGRDMSNFGLRWGGLSWDGGDPNAGTGPDREPLTGTAEQVAEDVRAQAKLGVTNMSAGSSADSLAGAARDDGELRDRGDAPGRRLGTAESSASFRLRR